MTWVGEESPFLDQADEISKSVHKVVSPMGEPEGFPLFSMFSFPRKGFFEKTSYGATRCYSRIILYVYYYVTRSYVWFVQGREPGQPGEP